MSDPIAFFTDPTDRQEREFQEEFNFKFPISTYRASGRVKAYLREPLEAYCREHLDALFHDPDIAKKITGFTGFIPVGTMGFSDGGGVPESLDFIKRHIELTPDQLQLLGYVRIDSLRENEENWSEIAKSLSVNECQWIVNSQSKAGVKQRFSELQPLTIVRAKEYVVYLKRNAFEQTCRPLFKNSIRFSNELSDRMHTLMHQYFDEHDANDGNARYGMSCYLGEFLGIYYRSCNEQYEGFPRPDEDFEQRLDFIQNHLTLKAFQFKLLKRESLADLLADPELVRNYGTLTFDDYILVTEYSKNPRNLFHEPENDRSNETKHLRRTAPLYCSSH